MSPPLPHPPRRSFLFGDFELDPELGVLRRRGHRVKLQPQPFRVLHHLLLRAPEIVTRDELGQAVWGGGVHVELDQSVGYCIRQIRQVLDDSATTPLYVETLPRLGYRFIGTIAERPAVSPEPAGASPLPSPMPESSRALEATPPPAAAPVLGAGPEPAPRQRRTLLPWAALVLATAAAAWWYHAFRAAPLPQSIAVLPLENLSGDPAQDYFADSLTEELITMLARNSTLRVVSRTSALAYKGAHRPLPEIARELGVDSIVEGSAARSGSRIHLTLQLIQAQADTHLWAESYDRSLDDVPTLPREIAESIAGRLHRALPNSEPQAGASHPVNPRAHDAYVHGRYLWAAHAYEEAKPYFEQAVAIQPDYALGLTGLADYYGAAAVAGRLDPRLAFPQQERYAGKALELEDTLAQAHLSMAATLLFSRWDFAGADREARRALQMDPRLSEAYYVRAMILAVLNRFPEAIESEKKALELDPFGRPHAVARFYDHARQYDAALTEAFERLKSAPNDIALNNLVANIYWHQGRFDQAVQYDEKTYLLRSDPSSASALRRAFAGGGPRGVLRWHLQQLERRAPTQYTSPVVLAGCYAALEDREKTLSLLEEGYRRHDPGLLAIQADPSYDFLHADPRYRTLVQNIGLPPAY